MTEIVLLKLQSAEEIIGKVVDTDIKTGDLVLSHVRALIMGQTPEGHLGIRMIPWSVGLPDEELFVPISAVIGKPTGPLPKDLEDGYLQNTSGLAFASKP